MVVCCFAGEAKLPGRNMLEGMFFGEELVWFFEKNVFVETMILGCFLVKIALEGKHFR